MLDSRVEQDTILAGSVRSIHGYLGTHIALQPQGLACKLPTLQASLRLVHLKLAAEFVRIRYAHGLAVLDREMQRATWTSDERHDSQAEDRVRKQQAELCLRQCTGNVVYADDVARIGEPFREAMSKVRAKRHAALAEVSALFEYLELVGVGRMVPDPRDGKRMCFQKRTYWAMSESAQKFLRKGKVPIWSFSIDYAHMDQPLQGADIKNATSKFIDPAETVTKSDLKSVCVPENQCEDETAKVLDDVKS